MSEPFSAILLDLDGTLVDSAPELAAALNGALAGLGRRRLAVAEVRAMIGDGLPALTSRALAATGTSPGGEAFEGILAEVRRQYALQPPSPIYPGVPETLARLSGRGFALGVCTNKPQGAAEKLLAEIGLAPHLSGVAGGDRFAVRKPDPGHLLGLLEIMGADAASAVMVGDSANDARAAGAAGLPFIAVSYGYATGPIDALGAVRVIDRFADIEDALAALAEA